MIDKIFFTFSNENTLNTHHKIIIGNSIVMNEISDEEVHLIITSPPYFNAPFDYEGLYTIEKKIQSLIKNKANFMNLSRELAQKAQSREVITKQPKEKLEGIKATLTIKNYLGGYYYLTCDEVVTDVKAYK